MESAYAAHRGIRLDSVHITPKYLRATKKKTEIFTKSRLLGKVNIIIF